MNNPAAASAGGDAGIDLSKIKKPLSQAKSMLEMAVLLLSRHLNLEPRQVVSLLADDCLYFGHLVVKGLRSSFLEVVGLFTELQLRLGQVAELCRTPEDASFLLQLLKPCLLSRNKELPVLATAILQQLRPQLGLDLYPLLTRPSGIVASWCLAIKRHPDLLPTMLQGLLGIANDRYSPLLLNDLRSLSASERDYLHLIGSVLPLLDKAKFVQEGCLAGMFNICEGLFQRDGSDVLQGVLTLFHQMY